MSDYIRAQDLRPGDQAGERIIAEVRPMAGGGVRIVLDDGSKWDRKRDALIMVTRASEPVVEEVGLSDWRDPEEPIVVPVRRISRKECEDDKRYRDA